MSDEPGFLSGIPADEMAGYLQLYLDETSEQLDALVETLLVLESEPASGQHLNEAFRLIHSVKGSSAMLGFESITALTHHLETYFERLRSGLSLLDAQTMGLILRCIDFLRQCQVRLREGQSLGGAPDLLAELARLENAAAPPAEIARPAATSEPREPSVTMPETLSRTYRISVRFEQELQLVDLKAELVCHRLADLCEIRASDPPPDDLPRVTHTRWMQLLVVSDRSAPELQQAADIGGVEWTEVVEGDVLTPMPASFTPPGAEVLPLESPSPPAARVELSAAEAVQPAAIEVESPGEAKTRIVETVRVDIGRLDDLMNLAGELVITQARFSQLAQRMRPAFKKASIAGRARAFGDTVRRLLKQLDRTAAPGSLGADWDAHLLEIEAELELLEEQSRQWEESRRYFGQVTDAIDQLSRVSTGLQRGVLDTRMVPVGPLFNRFKRVVRDISQELGKKVALELQGETTELDKRMIDELGDPLVHLVRNAIDHGIEPAADRRAAGKPEVGTLRLRASHRGNSVYIHVSDDGRGIDVDRVRARAIERGLVSASAAAELTEREVIEFIWSPGFSTAQQVSEISGRGVGMDIVKTRILELNGITTIDHVPGQGTTFTIRLPLTLAIIRSLLFRVRHGVFAVPIENVREIVSVSLDQIVEIRGRRTFEVRGEFIPLVDVDDIFHWHTVDYGHDSPCDSESSAGRIDVVILDSATRAMGLRVAELLGGQDIVIKSLSENFADIRGLSGASVLGDGSVGLLLDVGAATEIALAAPDRRQRPQLTVVEHERCP